MKGMRSGNLGVLNLDVAYFSDQSGEIRNKNGYFKGACLPVGNDYGIK
jgi:hypothetical protein